MPWNSKRWPRPLGSSWSSVAASCARSQRSRSSRSSASIISWSSLPLLGAERCHERLHLRHPSGELLDDVVEVSRARKGRPVARQEGGHVGLAAGESLLEQPIELAHHLAVRGEVLRRDSLESRPTARRSGHRAPGGASVSSRPSNRSPRVRLDEVVVGEAAYPPADVLGQRLELLLPMPGERRLPSSLGSRRSNPTSRRSTARRSDATISSSSWRTSASTSPSW